MRLFGSKKKKSRLYHIEIDDEGIDSSIQNLHAKVFVLEKDNNSTMFLGSANCSAPAFDRNIEFLTELNRILGSLLFVIVFVIVLRF